MSPRSKNVSIAYSSMLNLIYDYVGPPAFAANRIYQQGPYIRIRREGQGCDVSDASFVEFVSDTFSALRADVFSNKLCGKIVFFIGGVTPVKPDTFLT